MTDKQLIDAQIALVRGDTEKKIVIVAELNEQIDRDRRVLVCSPGRVSKSWDEILHDEMVQRMNEMDEYDRKCRVFRAR